MFRRGILTVAAVALLGLVTSGAPALASNDRPAFPERIELPNGFQPEGIAIGPGPFAYFGSRLDGDIFRADLRTGAGQVISQGPGTPSVGVKTDDRGRLFVSGGVAGDGRVVDTRTGDVLASYQFADPAAGPTFVNDVVLTQGAAWFTDSRQPFLYKVPLRHGRLPAAADVEKLPLTGELVFAEGNNSNGIAPTPDGRALLVVQSNKGLLFRVDPRTGVTEQVDLGETSLANGDGLLLQGRTLYAVQNRLNQVAVLRLDRDGDSGRLVKLLTDPGFDVPTTVAAFDDRLYLPNARFTTTPEPTTPYWVTAIDAGC
jgi:sugar lactone lactonase YvrE